MLREGLLLAAAFSAVVLGSISAFGINTYVLSLAVYLYFLLPVLMYLIHLDTSLKDLKELKSDVLIVVDREERRVKNLITGEEFVINDSQKVD